MRLDLGQTPVPANRINWRNRDNMRSARLIRRAIGALLIVAGALLMWLSPETRAGASLLLIGAGVEVAGLALERRAQNDGEDRHAVDR
jgi:hypothetical protein